MTAPETVETQTYSEEQIPADSNADAYLSGHYELEATENYLHTKDTTHDSDVNFDSQAFESDIALYEAQQGDEAAAAFLLHSLRSIIAKGAVPHGTNPIDREDYIQNAHEKIFKYLIKRPDNFKGGNLEAYVFTTARNSTRDMVRKDERRPRLEFSEEPVNKAITTNQGAETSEAHDRMVTFLLKSACNRDQITAILLAHVYHYSGEEIAAMTGANINTVRTRVHKGLSKVRQQWGFVPKGEAENQQARTLIAQELAMSA